jgi:hypothetical protein
MSDTSQIPPPDPPRAPQPADPGFVPLHSGLRRLVTSAKAIVALIAVVGVIVMNMMGKISGADALNFVTVVVMSYFGAHAIEDGAEKFAGGKPKNVDYAAIIGPLVDMYKSIVAGNSGGNEPAASGGAPRYRPLQALRPQTKEEIEAMLGDMIAPEPPVAAVIPIKPKDDVAAEKPPSAG